MTNLKFSNPTQLFEKYRDYFLLNRTLIVSIFSAMLVSALCAQGIKDHSGYVNATLTIAVSYIAYYIIFGLLYYRDNKEKYISKSGFVNKQNIRNDLFKILTSVGLAEILYLTSRWILHYYLLETGQEPFLVSILAHLVAASIFVLAVNIGVNKTKLYNKQRSI